MSLPGERWRQLLDSKTGVPFKGYEVSSMGRVRSYRVGGRCVSLRPFPKLRKLCPVDKHGITYMGLMFYREKKLVHREVHLLILTSFRGFRPLWKVARHLDGDSTNNVLRNLKWGTPIENEKDKLRHGTHQYGERNPSAKLTNKQADIVRRSVGPLRAMSVRFGITEGTVSRIRNGTRRPQWSSEL